MGAFLKAIKYEIVLAKLTGFAFFPVDFQKSTKIFDYCYCLPYMIIYTTCLTYTLLVLKEVYIYSYWITLLANMLLFTVIFIQYSIPLYFLINRNELKSLLIEIDKYSTFTTFDKEYKKRNEKRIAVYGNIAILIGYFAINCCTYILENISYTLPLYMLQFQQYWIFNIVFAITLEKEAFDTVLLGLSRNKDKIKFIALKKVFLEYKKMLTLCRKINKLFGIPILLNLSSIFIGFISTIQFTQFAIRQNFQFKMLLLDNALWFVGITFRLYHTLKCWIMLNNEVCK